MKFIVVDTNILIDYAKGYAEWVDDYLQLSSPVNLVLPTIVIAEYFASRALEDEKEVHVAEKTFSLFKKQDLTESIAKIVGKILRHKSHPTTASIPDIVVAATALFLNAELATRNKRDFAKIPHLRFFDPKYDQWER
ncbi:PIN domain-containing protein [Candidatus Gottesmanbacteria bacterium]|nr:PIN domain-containing protein [Candidatus Gottesmanbacteria bacterium]